MRVILQVTAGPSVGRQIPLQVGEIARFGSSTIADVCFPDDVQLSAVHFEVACYADRCLLRNLPSSSGTFVNDKLVTEAELTHGDTILAGSTRLSAKIQGVPSDERTEAAEAEEPPSHDSSPEKPSTLAEVCGLLELDEESVQWLQPEHTPDTFLTTLVGHQKFDDAIRLLSYFLPKREAVWWAYHSVQELLGKSFSTDEQAVMDAVLAWLKEPNDSNRRAAMQAAEADEFQSAASWVGLAAFWSDGSLAPPDLPEVVPDACLTSQGVTAALLLTANQGDLNQSVQKYQSILKAGKEIRSGSLPLPA